MNSLGALSYLIEQPVSHPQLYTSTSPDTYLIMDLLTEAKRGARNHIQLLNAWAEFRPDKVHVSVLKSTDISEGFREVTHLEIRQAADAFAWWLAGNYGHSDVCETIGYVGLNDLRYAVFYYGAIKAGYKVSFFVLDIRDMKALKLLLYRLCSSRRATHLPPTPH